MKHLNLHPHHRQLRRDTDMTTGNVFGHLIRFSIPLLLGNIFQQLYNTVDTWVVGNFVSDEAFSAVGTVGPITNMLIGFFLGLSSGAGVVISQYYGPKRCTSGLPLKKVTRVGAKITTGIINSIVALMARSSAFRVPSLARST